MTDLDVLRQAIVDGADDAAEVTRALLAAGVSPHDVVHRALLPGVDEVGDRVKEGSFALPDAVRSVQAMKACLRTVRPGMDAGGPLGVVVIGTPKSELHDLGKHFTALLLDGAGFEVHDVGTDVPPQAFVDGVVEHGATIVAVSALLTTVVPSMRRVVEALAEAGVRDRVKVMVGGTGVRAGAVARIGADAGCAGAAETVECAWRLAGVDF